MMCKERRRLRAYLDGEVTQKESEMLKSHLEECGDCRTEQAALQRRMVGVSTALGALSAEGAPTSPEFAFARWQARCADVPSFAFGMFAGRDSRERRHKGALGSVLVHLGVAGLVLAAGTNPVVQGVALHSVQIFAPVLRPAPEQASHGGGGGGGNHSRTPPDSGHLPPLAQKQFIAPSQITPAKPAALMIEPTIDIQPDVKLASNLQQLGNPMDGRALPSNGPGSGGGIGSGKDGGIGSGVGIGVGPGFDGGMGGAYRIGGGVSQPALLAKTDPEYSEEARKAKFQGTVVLTVVVDATGRVSQVRVARSLGLGLDEKAMEAVQKWRFRPGMKDGHAVPVLANVEVNFRLL